MVEVLLVDSGFTSGTWTFCSGKTRRACMNESSAFSLVTNFFEVDYESGRVVLCVSEHFGTEEGDDMI